MAAFLKPLSPRSATAMGKTLPPKKRPTSKTDAPINKLKSNPPISNIRGSGAFRDGQQ